MGFYGWVARVYGWVSMVYGWVAKGFYGFMGYGICMMLDQHPFFPPFFFISSPSPLFAYLITCLLAGLIH